MCVTFYSKQTEGDCFNLICRQYVSKRGCYKVLQAICQHHQSLGLKVGHDREIDLLFSGCPIGQPPEKKNVAACKF